MLRQVCQSAFAIMLVVAALAGIIALKAGIYFIRFS